MEWNPGQRGPVKTHAPNSITSQAHDQAPTTESSGGSGLSRNFISDFGSDLKNVLGGSLGGMETAIETAFGTAQESLSRKASALGADAVIGLQLQLESVSDKAQAVMLIGTAVRITRDPAGTEPVSQE